MNQDLNQDQKINLIGFTATKDDKGLWIYKANESEAFKKNSVVLKKKYHDLPRYKVILEIENNFQESCNDFLLNLTTNLVKTLKSFVK